MTKKEITISMLEDIKQLVQNDEGKEKILNIVDEYIKILELSENDKVKRLIRKHVQYCQKYGEENEKTLKITKKITKEIKKKFKS